VAIEVRGYTGRKAEMPVAYLADRKINWIAGLMSDFFLPRGRRLRVVFA
jgi:hypothetical protein